MTRATRTFAVACLIAATALPVTPAQAAPKCFGKEATIVGTSGHDVLEGTPGNDVIVGNGGVDAVTAKGGDDRICLSDGWVDDPSTIDAGSGSDRIDAGDGASNVSAGDGRDVVYGRGGEDMVVGGRLADTVFGGEGVDYLFGEGGHDRLHGEGGNDVVHGYDGDDVLDGGPGGDRVFFTELCCDYSYDSGGVRVNLTKGTAKAADGSDQVMGFEEIYGSKGADVLIGSGRGEVLYGLDGNDELDGRGGADTLVPDDDFENPAGNDDVVDGGAGEDTVRYSGSGRVTVDLREGTAGGPERGEDTLAGIENVIGSNRGDRLLGDAGDNHLVGDPPGGGGRDYLDGRAGVDTLDGAGGSNDTCVNGETVERCELKE